MAQDSNMVQGTLQAVQQRVSCEHLLLQPLAGGMFSCNIEAAAVAGNAATGCQSPPA
jgi:hypothetical protein